MRIVFFVAEPVYLEISSGIVCTEFTKMGDRHRMTVLGLAAFYKARQQLMEKNASK